MADKKISQLTGATTPLAGTEVLPIVQSGSTVKVSVANLTTGRDVTMDNAIVNGHANVLGGDVRFDDERWVYSYAGGTVGQYMSGTYYDGGGLTQRIFLNNAEVARWTNGNLQVSVAAKGINFTANANAPGMTSELLNWYEEGTWTPTDASGAGLTFTYTAAEMRYTRIGRNVFIQGRITYPSTASAATVLIGGLPFTSSASNRAGLSLGYNSFVANYVPFVSAGSSLIEFYTVASGGTQATNVNLSASTFAFSGMYTV